MAELQPFKTLVLKVAWQREDMNLDLKYLKDWCKSAYDKMALFLTLFGLLVSVALLLMFLESEKRELVAARWEQPVTEGKQVAPLDMRDLHEAIETVAQPFQVAPSSARMLVAEVRTACVQCQRPIPLDATVCPYKNCGAAQPVISQTQGDKDNDGDGMPDVWEKKHGLNPLLDDAALDLDADGFTNLEEFALKTDPGNAMEFPSPLTKLKLLKIARMPMPLSFQGVQRLTTNDVLFTVRNNSTHRDYYVRLGETVEGYQVAGFEPRIVPVQVKNLTLNEDRSILRMRKDNREVSLVLGRGVGQGELTAQLINTLDNSEHRVQVGSQLKLKNIVYKIIDIQQDAIVVLNEVSGEKSPIKL